MRRCGGGSTKFSSTNAHKNAMLPSSCNPYHGEGTDAGTFSIFFATGDNDEQPENVVEPYCASSISAVDCTLSLGTPSTRSQSHSARKCPPLLGIQHQQQHYYPLRWDFTSYQPKPSSSSAAAAVSTATLGAAGAASCGLNSGGDPVLLARRCANCDTTSTPLWRNGPKGPKSLCNACGIRYKKEKRRAASFAVTSPSTSLSSPACTLPTATHPGPFSLLQQQQQQQQRCETGYVYEHPCSYSATRKSVARKSPSEAFISSMSPGGEDEVIDVTAPPGLPWWLNVPIGPRMVEYAPGLLQDYT